MMLFSQALLGLLIKGALVTIALSAAALLLMLLFDVKGKKLW